MPSDDFNETKGAIDTERSADSQTSRTPDELPDADAQPGVQDIEATAMAWTRTNLIIAYVMLWFIYFVETMLSGVNDALLPYVTSDFALHSLTPTVSVLSSVIGGVTNLTIAKILDVFGRPQGYLFCVFLAVIGLIMMAACNTVETYAAAMVFYTIGNNGVQYSISVFVADTSKLKNRGLMQALVNSAVIITTWLAGPISQGFLNGVGWRWCYGIFTILVPVVTLPLFGLLLRNYLKAKKLGLIPKRDSGRTFVQSFFYYCRQFDAIGLLLCSAGVALFLLPFNLYTIQAQGWGSALVISMLVVGIVLLIAFVVWERFFAPFTFIPYSLLMDRTVFGACLLAAALFSSYFVWDSFFSSFLQVVKDLDVQHASYVSRSYTVVGIVVAILVGCFIHLTGRFKYITLYVAIPLSILGQALLIYFRQPDSHIGYVVMCFIFIATGQGIIVISDEIAILAAASHEYVAICIAVLGIFSNIGGAIGSTIASAVWQSSLPNKLTEYLPADQLQNLTMIYGSIDTQLSYPVGSPTRLAIQRAYGDAIQALLATSTGIWVIGIVGILMWRNLDVKEIKQTKGHVW
jgi:MFS family permease